MNELRTADGRLRTRPILSWIIGMILCPLGVAFAAKSGFGVSMIEAPVYVSYLYLKERLPWYSFGTAEYILQAILLVLLCVATRRFRWRYLLSFGTAYVFGRILDAWYLLLGHEVYADMGMRLVGAVLGLTITALAVSFFFRTWLPQEVWELFVKEFSERYSLDMTRVKFIYDLSSLGVGILLMLVFFRGFRWDAIGIGTLVTTLVNAPLIGLCGRLQDRLLAGWE